MISTDDLWRAVRGLINRLEMTNFGPENDIRAQAARVAVDADDRTAILK